MITLSCGPYLFLRRMASMSLLWLFATVSVSGAFSTLRRLSLRSRTPSNSFLEPPRSGDWQLNAHTKMMETDRREFIQGNAALAFCCSLIAPSTVLPANARGLVMFPCSEPLGCTYHFMRAGESLLEAENIWSTNPLFLTNREATLSDLGTNQVTDSCRQLLNNSESRMSPTLVRYSLAAASMDTVNIVGKELKVGRDRLVPEFNFMDPRGMGAWDMSPLSETQAAVWAMDKDEAGTNGGGARPPANEDGTPQETLQDQTIRLRQLLSVLETDFSGDTILLIFPDGTGPALLSAMIAGIPFNRVHELEYRPGEIRMDVTMDSTLALWAEKRRTEKEEYAAAIQRGRTELSTLRQISPTDVVSLKDQRLEEERVKSEQQVVRVAEERNKNQETQREEQRERAKQVEAERQAKRDAIITERRERANIPRALVGEPTNEKQTPAVQGKGGTTRNAKVVQERNKNQEFERLEQRERAKQFEAERQAKRDAVAAQRREKMNAPREKETVNAQRALGTNEKATSTSTDSTLPVIPGTVGALAVCAFGLLRAGDGEDDVDPSAAVLEKIKTEKFIEASNITSMKGDALLCTDEVSTQSYVDTAEKAAVQAKVVEDMRREALLAKEKAAAEEATEEAEIVAAEQDVLKEAKISTATADAEEMAAKEKAGKEYPQIISMNANPMRALLSDTTNPTDDSHETTKEATKEDVYEDDGFAAYLQNLSEIIEGKDDKVE